MDKISPYRALIIAIYFNTFRLNFLQNYLTWLQKHSIPYYPIYLNGHCRKMQNLYAEDADFMFNFKVLVYEDIFGYIEQGCQLPSVFKPEILF